MAYSEQVLRRAQARLAQEKADCESESAARIEAIYQQFPRLKEIDRAKVAAAMMDALWQMERQLLTEKEAVLHRYRKDCITLGQEISLLRLGEPIRHGRAVELDEDGALIVEFSDGHRETVNSGEVSVRGMYGYL